MKVRWRYWWATSLFALAALSWTRYPTANGQSPQRSPAPAAQQRPLQTGELDIERSRVYVHVGKIGLGHEHGVEGRTLAGSILLGAAQNAGQIVFDMASLKADTPAARKYVGLNGTTDAATRRDVNANMLGPDVLDVRNYPTATFQIASALPLFDTERRLRGYQLEGQFTLHGVTRPLKVNAETVQEAGFVRLRCSFAILQSQFGMTPYSKAFGVIGVADRLTIYGDAWLASPEFQ